MKRAPMRRTPRKPYVCPHLAEFPREAWFAGRVTCVWPGCRRGGHIARHHAIYEQHLREIGAPLWDPRNRVGACDREHHPKHHARALVMPLLLLPDSVFGFAVEWLPNPYGYLRKRYAGDDPRLEALLA